MGAGAAPIRFGVISEGSQLLAWHARCLTDLCGAANAQWVIHVKTTHVLADAKERQRTLTSWLYGRLIRDAKASSQKVADPLPQARDAITVTCQPEISESGSVSFDNATIAKLSSLELDFLLYFGSARLTGDILRVARHGVWAYRLHAIGSSRTATPAFWEIVDGENITGAVLLALGQSDDAILREGYLATTAYSYSKNLDNLCFAAARWPAFVCRSLERLGRIAHEKRVPFERQPHEMPNLGAMLKFAFITTLQRINRNFVIYLYRPIWNVGIVNAPIDAFVDTANSRHADAVSHVRWLKPLRGGAFLADPFPFQRDGRTFVFAEEFEYALAKGRIVAFELADGDRSSPSTAIEEQHHLSYPYIVEDDSKVYCIPESFEAREIALYKALDYPLHWEKTAVLVKDFAGNDSTLLHYNDKWWLFCTDYDVGFANALCVFYADQLRGPWTAHPMNPVKIDVRSACPAGTPFVAGGKLYRPAQDCSKRYGWRVTINRVVTLSEQDFYEEQASIVEPFADGSYRAGTHTLSSFGANTVVDGHRYEFYLGGIRHLVRSYGRRALESAGFSENAIAWVKDALR